ncbi:MAG TPA: hypothetical protein VMT00_10115 [Thermoanaerobaculia bacterium]|nr:hypothetical protein [Thermoanaerobaculia bacterium]
MMEGFDAQAAVILNLVNPKEKFWGILQSLSPVGVTLRGINLDSFDDWVRQLARNEDQNLDLVTMFVPLFRIERIFLDEPVGAVKSYCQRFEEIVGAAAIEYLQIEKTN